MKNDFYDFAEFNFAAAKFLDFCEI